MYLYWITVTIIAGLMLGSFFNVVIWRLPRGESIVLPGSHCPSCNRPIRPWENVPVFSYLFLRGRCAGCAAAISWRYPFIELLTALYALLLYHEVILPHSIHSHTFWEHLFTAVRVVSLLTLIPIAAIDIEHFIIPDSITISGVVVGFLSSFLPGTLTPLESLLGIVAGGGSLYALGLLGEFVLRKQEAMGGGDIKMMAFLGALWGWKVALLAIVFGSLIGVAASLVMLCVKALPRDRRIPFGPFLAAGTVLAAFWGEQLLNAYFELVERLFLG